MAYRHRWNNTGPTDLSSERGVTYISLLMFLSKQCLVENIQGKLKNEQQLLVLRNSLNPVFCGKIVLAKMNNRGIRQKVLDGIIRLRWEFGLVQPSHVLKIFCWKRSEYTLTQNDQHDDPTWTRNRTVWFRSHLVSSGLKACRLCPELKYVHVHHKPKTRARVKTINFYNPLAIISF